MQEFDEIRPDPRENAQRFERMMKNQEQSFFDLDIYEEVVEHYIDTGNNARALEVCELGLRNFPYSLELMLDKAHLLSENKNYDDALDLVEQASLLHPNDIDVLYLEAGIYAKMGEHEKALELYETVLHRANEDEKDEVLFQIGHVHQDGANFDKAIEIYKEVIELNLNHEGALFEMGFCLDVTDKLESYVSYYEALTDRDPYSHVVWYNLGIVYSKLERFEDALRAYDYACVIKENFASAYFNMANAYMNLEKFQKANEYYLLTLTHEPATADLYCHLGASYEKMGYMPKAMECYREALKLDGNWDDAWYGLSTSMLFEERFIEALSCINKAIKINDQVADYWTMVGVLEFKIGNIMSAEEAFEKSTELEPDFEPTWLQWSFMYFDSQNYQKAFQVIEQALDVSPESADLYYRAAVYLLYKGDYREALLYIEIAVTLDYEKHTQLFDFFPELEKQKAIFKLIEQFRK